MKLRVVKVGGRPLGDPVWLAEFAAMAARSATPLVVVHGGGPEIDTLSARLGLEVERRDGLRVTTAAGLELAVMVLSGLLNKRLVAALQGAGVDALGLSGEDGGLVQAELSAGGVLGHVGQVTHVRTELLHGLLTLGVVPVLSPISRAAAADELALSSPLAAEEPSNGGSPHSAGGPCNTGVPLTGGGALNVNADDVAVAVAAALGAEELLFLTDVPAVRGLAGDLEELSVEEAEQLIVSGVIHDGMAVKVRAALRGLSSGLSTVRIGGAATLADAGAGTRFISSAVTLGELRQEPREAYV